MGSQPLRIGHGGADALAPGNSLRSFDAAVEIGVDMIEFDVRVVRNELVLAHTVLDGRRPGCLRLSEALAYLATSRFSGVAVNLDVKHVGFEAAMLDALRQAGMRDRALISSQVLGVLDRVRRLDPRVRTGISIGNRVARASQRWRRWRADVMAGLEAGRWNALMAQHRLVDAGLVGDVIARGGELHAWTVNRRELIAPLQDLGVHGIVTADPRLFIAGTVAPRARPATECGARGGPPA